MKSIARITGIIGILACCVAIGCAPITRAYDLDEAERNAITDSLEVTLGDPVDLTADLPEGYHLVESSVEVIEGGWYGPAVAFEAEGPTTHTLLPPKKLFLNVFRKGGGSLNMSQPGELFEPSFSDGIRNEKWRVFFWNKNRLACIRQLAGEVRVYELAGTEFQLIGARASVTDTILGAWGNGTTITFIGSRWEEPGDMDLLGARTQVFWMRQLCAGEWSPETLIRRQAEADVRMENIITVRAGENHYALITQEHRPGLVMGFEYDFIYAQRIVDGQVHAPEAIGVYQSPARLVAETNNFGELCVVWAEPDTDDGFDGMRLVVNSLDDDGQWAGPAGLARSSWPAESHPSVAFSFNPLIVWRESSGAALAVGRGRTSEGNIWGPAFTLPASLGEQYWLTPLNYDLSCGRNPDRYHLLTVDDGIIVRDVVVRDTRPVQRHSSGSEDTGVATGAACEGNVLIDVDEEPADGPDAPAAETCIGKRFPTEAEMEEADDSDDVEELEAVQWRCPR